MANNKQTKFFPGDLVEVRPLNEILGTRELHGTLEKLPFMPEMTAFAGQRFRVTSRAFKTCVDDAEMRSIDNTVFLDNVRCDGKAHGGCDKACLIFWKEEWLKPAGAKSESPAPNAKITEADLGKLANRDGNFFCQSSEIVNASTPLPFWQPSQYLLDLVYNRISLARWLR